MQKTSPLNIPFIVKKAEKINKKADIKQKKYSSYRIKARNFLTYIAYSRLKHLLAISVFY